MSASAVPRSSQAARLASQARQQLVSAASAAMTSLVPLVRQHLEEQLRAVAPPAESRARREAWTAFEQLKSQWRDGTLAAWEKLQNPDAVHLNTNEPSSLELLGTEVLEHKILASRLANEVMEVAAKEVNHLRKRLRSLEGDQELSASDLVHPEVLLLPVVSQWEATGMSRSHWERVQKVVQSHFKEQLQSAYAQCNAELIRLGVLPNIEPVAARSKPSRTASPGSNDFGPDTAQAPSLAENGASAAPTPRRRFEDRAQGVLEQVGRILGGFFNSDGALGRFQAPSVPLMEALAQQPVLSAPTYEVGSAVDPTLIIQRVVHELRQQSADIKVKAETDSEKAIIELVALMFQSILQEDRIPTGVRVWFARLQMPVLRIALAEPVFFSDVNHPARQLIDHMGSCVLGFDASGISSDALEQEIKRVVQVIEQYPETGDRVFKKVYEEFQEFLRQHLTSAETTQKVVGVAQQLEQRETLTIQFTIELRDQLKSLPVRDEIRDFLFKVWAEVMAVSAVRYGVQHDQTLRLKSTASNLIWAASSKPNRNERSRVIATLPSLLQTLRDGMMLAGVGPDIQESHVRIISDTLADAFMSKTDAIADEQILSLASHLEHLEDYIGDDGVEDLTLDAQDIEDLLGVDVSELDVIAGSGGTDSFVMLEWVRELPLGSWYTLEHNEHMAQVQYAWRSPMEHLHLFSSSVGHSYLFLTRRLAGYLQRGMMEPQEEETLMTRAARDAVDKIEANPERLLA